MAARQLKIGLRVRDLDRSHRLYLRLGFKEIPQTDQTNLRYLTFGHTWLILSDLHRHGHHNAEREREVKAGPPGLGVVLTVPTTGDEDIFTFAQRTFTEWGIGQKKDNNGGLFVVAIQDRKMRIHTGYGLEGGLTDALSKPIIETIVAPKFRAGDYYGGISDGVDAIIAAVKGEYAAPPEASGGSDTMFYIIIIIFILFFLWSVWQANSRGGGGGGRSYRRSSSPGVMLPNIWTTGGGSSSGGWGHSGGDGGGGFGGFGGGFGGGSSGGGGASGSW